jgi:hypothetical protein
MGVASSSNGLNSTTQEEINYKIEEALKSFANEFTQVRNRERFLFSFYLLFFTGHRLSVLLL